MKFGIFTFSILFISAILLPGCQKEPIYPSPSPPPPPQKVKLGQNYAGGIVFYVDAGGFHGLTVSKSSVAYNQTWYAALEICSQSTLNGYYDWRLPSKEEMQLLIQQVQANVISNFGGSLWSSTEKDNQYVWCMETLSSPGGGSYMIIAKNKSDIYTHVRAVRAF